MTISDSNHSNYFPIGTAITHSYYFLEDDSGIKGFLKAKINPSPGQAPRFSQARIFNLTDPKGQIDFDQLKEYCAMLNINELDAQDIQLNSGPLTERFSKKISEELCLRDAFPPQRRNSVLKAILTQLKLIPVSSEVSALKNNLVEALENIYEKQEITHQPVSSVYHCELLEQLESVRKAFFSALSKGDQAYDQLAEFDNQMLSYFIETSWCQAVQNDVNIKWWG